MMTRLLLILGAVIALAESLTIPIQPGQARCMVVFTLESEQNLKLDLRFEPLPNQLPQEYYELVLTNTETESQTRATVVNGKYREELILQAGIAYRICMKLYGRRVLGRFMEIEYNADLGHTTTGQAHEVKVPDNLLKVKDLAETYKIALSMNEKTDQFAESQKARTETEDQLYVQITSSTSMLITVSMLELGVILLAGLYQFWSIRSFLVNKQYI